MGGGRGRNPFVCEFLDHHCWPFPSATAVGQRDFASTDVVGLTLPPGARFTVVGEVGMRIGELARRAGVSAKYPLTGRPGVDLPEGWDNIPDARGCSTEACDFRDHYSDLQQAGAARVFGMSSQTPDYQAEVVERLHLPFSMLSDPDLALADALQLPTFTA
jgi:hypothetical protein